MGAHLDEQLTDGNHAVATGARDSHDEVVSRHRHSLVRLPGDHPGICYPRNLIGFDSAAKARFFLMQ